MNAGLEVKNATSIRQDTILKIFKGEQNFKDEKWENMKIEVICSF